MDTRVGTLAARILRTGLLAFTVIAVGLVPATTVSAQGQGSVDVAAQEEALREQAEELFRRAEAIFNSVQQDRSIRMLSDLVNLLDRRLNVADDPELRQLLTQSISYRSQAHYNFGQLEQADADMRRLVQLNPGYDLDTTTLSPKFVERFEELRTEMVGRLDIVLTPSTAELLVDGRQARPSLGPIYVLAGTRVVTAELPGYTPFRQEVEVEADGIQDMTIDLERVYAVAKIVTWPKGATVELDGQPVGVTQGSPPLEFFPVGDAASIPISEFSDYMFLEVLPGTHTLEVSLDGYRSQELDLEVPDLLDYEPEPVVLEAARGDIVLSGVPDGSTVRVDGEIVEAPDAPISVSPGEHELQIEHPTEGFYEATVTLADRDALPLDIELRPVANLVGVIGGDELAAGSLTDTLQESFLAQESWILRDRTGESAAVLDRMGAVQTVLQEAARGETGNLRGVPWRRIQSELDDAVPGSLYVLAVLSDDLMATHADVWVLAPAPGPAEPDRLRVAIEDMIDMERFASRLDLPEFSYQGWWGATLIDAPGGGPVVAEMQADGPAAEAGVERGDRVVAVDGTPVLAAAEIQQRIATAAPGARMTLLIDRAGVENSIDLTVGESATVAVARDSQVPAAAVWVAANRAMEAGRAEVPDWMLRLNAAIAHMRVRDWDGAVRMLRTIEAPDAPGLGQASVDYLLGVALFAAGGEYEATAREAFARAAESTDGRLDHNDGPSVRPRALARLGALDDLTGATGVEAEAGQR